MSVLLDCRPADTAAVRPGAAPLLPVVGADTEVPLAPAGRIRYADLDSAASTRALVSVADQVAAALPLYASVHRGAGYLSQVSTALYESARDTVARFVGAGADDVCVLTRHTTDALNLLASAVPEGGAVLVLDCEHHADLLPWQRRGPVTVLPTAPTVVGTLRALGQELARAPYALVAVTGASNVTGESLPLAEVVALARAGGARVLVDGAQLVPHRAFSLTASGADYVVLSGHKTYAPFGTGALVGRRDWLDAAPAYLAGGGAVHEVTVAETSWAPAPHRHEGGSPNVLGAVALAAACDALTGLPVGVLEAARPARRRAGGAAGGAAAAHLGRLRRAHRRRRLHRRGRRPGTRRRLPVGRARHRRPGRPVLRPSAAGPARRARGRAAGQRRGGQHARRRRPADRSPGGVPVPRAAEPVRAGGRPLAAGR
jgi:selenocysteine lyase/cysteine desulfurase